MEEQRVEPAALGRYRELISRERFERLRGGAGMRELLGGRQVWNVNSTAAGGGVAELLGTLLPLCLGLGVEARWLVIDGEPDLFVVTKRIHNGLNGVPGDGGPLGAAERALYRRVSEVNAGELTALLRPGDLVILHDPQTAGLVGPAKRAGTTVVWRCHVGCDEVNDDTDRCWEFLTPWLEDADALVFSTEQHVPGWVRKGAWPVHAIAPSVDPFSAKSIPIDPATATAVLRRAGLLAGDAPAAVRVHHPDGSQITVRSRASVFREGPPPSPDTPQVVQVSRWDLLKDMLGVLRAFALTTGDGGADPAHPAHLALLGPEVDGVSDDPEGKQVLERCVAAWRELPEPTRRRVTLACLPMDDQVENAVIVNAAQRHAAVVVQKSLSEGFGLTVTEAMWKSRPVIASAVGGIRDQIVDGEHGLLLDDSTDPVQAARAIDRLLADRAAAERLGEQAHQRVVDPFLPDRHLLQYADLVRDLLA
jgi:trehalose synthase